MIDTVERFTKMVEQVWNDAIVAKNHGAGKEWTGEAGQSEFSRALNAYRESVQSSLFTTVRGYAKGESAPLTEEDWRIAYAKSVSSDLVAPHGRRLNEAFRTIHAYQLQYADSFAEINRARRSELVQLYISRMLTSLSLAALLLGTYWVAGKFHINLPMSGRASAAMAVPAPVVAPASAILPVLQQQAPVKKSPGTAASF